MEKAKLVTVPKTEFNKGDYALDQFSNILSIVDPVERDHSLAEGATKRGYEVMVSKPTAGQVGTFIKSADELRIIAIEEREIVKKPIAVENPEKSGELMEQLIDVEEITHTELDRDYWMFALTHVLGQEIPFTRNNGRVTIGAPAENMANALQILNDLSDPDRLRFIADYLPRIKALK